VTTLRPGCGCVRISRSQVPLTEEMTHLLNLIFALANVYDLDFEAIYDNQYQPGDTGLAD